MNDIASKSLRAGEYIIFALKLQVFCVVAMVRFGIVFGIFPALAAAFERFFAVFGDKEEVDFLKLSDVVNDAKKHFKKANIIGFLSFAIMLVLAIDIRINGKIIQNTYVHICLIVLLLLCLCVNFYLFPSLVRYSLTVKDTFKQAFFLVLCSVPQTIAIFIGLAIASYLSVLFPLLALLPIPVFFFSIAYFSFQAMKRLERMNEEAMNSEKDE
ncbi:Uncharacterized membrane protein YesL [Pilibacter termitis]|uniref:Uncharacterized membrane protein YesL n=1 Tax=Pilibacter termitis TaxID=263852 RepID=A0A1T4MA49_9ENTE|nr:DUF624 domain-containing protein [Pilibacter termitis]SJZ63812.1 Uncharacterized membrane protein YesL [Pilibacter termitis]